MDLYFQRHDGQAVTCEDFRNAMADANGQDLSAFEAWWVSALYDFGGNVISGDLPVCP